MYQFKLGLPEICFNNFQQWKQITFYNAEVSGHTSSQLLELKSLVKMAIRIEANERIISSDSKPEFNKNKLSMDISKLRRVTPSIETIQQKGLTQCPKCRKWGNHTVEECRGGIPIAATIGKAPDKTYDKKVDSNSCSACGKKGHWARYCPDRAKDSTGKRMTCGTHK